MSSRQNEAMTPRQRVLTALRNEQPDRVPIVDGIDWLPMTRLASLVDVEVPEAEAPFAFERLASRLTKRLGIDAIHIAMPLGLEPVDDKHLRDRYGSLYQLSEYGEPVVIEGPIASPADTEGFAMASRLTDEDFAPIRVARELLGPDYPVWVYFAETFKLSWKLRGSMQALLMDFVCEPEFVHRLARLTTDATIATVRGAAAAGADAVLLEGDLAHNTAPLFSPAHFDEYLKPYYIEIVQAAHDLGLPIVKHSDGAMWPLMEGLIECGFDGYHPIQPQCMNIAEAKARLGNRLCLIGNIDCLELLVRGSEQEVERVVRETIEIAGSGGGYMLCSSNSIHSDVRPENYLAMVRAGLQHGGYR